MIIKYKALLDKFGASDIPCTATYHHKLGPDSGMCFFDRWLFCGLSFPYNLLYTVQCMYNLHIYNTGNPYLNQTADSCSCMICGHVALSQKHHDIMELKKTLFYPKTHQFTILMVTNDPMYTKITKSVY